MMNTEKGNAHTGEISCAPGCCSIHSKTLTEVNLISRLALTVKLSRLGVTNKISLSQACLDNYLEAQWGTLQK